MSEDWRRKTFYKPRVLIDTARVLEPQFDDSLLCITGAQLEMLRNVTQYLKRRSTFCSELQEGYYLAPTQEEWDQVQAIVAELEETLMGCEGIETQLEAIAAQLACLCSAANRAVTDGSASQKLIDDYLDDGTLIPVDTYGGTTPAEADRCALAQLVYWQAWWVVVNLIGPLDELAIDLLMPALIALLGTLAGAPIVGIPAALLIMAVRGLIEAKNLGVLPDVLSTWEDAEEDIICALYRGLDTGYRAAENAAMKVIADLPVISPVDKVALHCLVCPWAMMVAQEALENATEFALDHVEAGYCADCNEIEGNDWWALYLPIASNTVEIDHPEASNWISGCWEYSLPAGWITNGVVFEVKNKVGDCQLKRMGKNEAGCNGSELWPNTSDQLQNGVYFAVDGQSIDEVTCKATLCPGAPTLTPIYSRTGALTINGGFHLGWDCTGSADIHVKYLVMRGSPP